MSRLGVALGADQLTFFGLAGLGDLYVTCASRHSRNRSVGEQIGKGASLDHILSSMNAIAEGVTTTKAALELAATVGIELPITQKVAQILFDGVDPRVAIRDLMLRPSKSEV
jgi:glycerol-3-phosphate dehydrogenase (NAD(P)+)